MVSTVITFSKSDIQGPVYVAGSFTEWSPVEMNCESTASGQNKFSYTCDLTPGKYQYKFRLGPGDWWVLDESTSTENDGAGNVNNVLAVEAEAEAEVEESTESRSMPAEEPAQVAVSATDAGEESTHPLSTHNMVTAVEDELEVRADDGPQDVQGLDVHKEDPIPDVAPPPYSVEEHAAAQAATNAQMPSVPDIVGVLKEKMSPEIAVPKESPPEPKTPETKQSGLLQK
ncbi:hypothetical protein LTR10_015310 [Elasticomyces elasticus]|uniref:AMP-activated protein kinase glycogen-binding domain-containing protein n=1 Tax=Exophiala sideris TaxID=1016849 RepID=A0ABR0JJD4_9EURO|nr:hypothetical protein LTR10_015310 [Elasticomyces elasticus]KAK5030290.1 hypothetical protein LTR13_008309 [Exophiala sideris]KAK5035055.1 hypothetical protein LTS07_002490 [Exophiala sideris]KAK5065978.1 hypothetical protein LTR69_002495 [Exophiala sideris]KAK5178355.1 hypothetical protein LTR44_009231 [Eurotiomycetes sp. CCFEE 6388]